MLRPSALLKLLGLTVNKEEANDSRKLREPLMKSATMSSCHQMVAVLLLMAVVMIQTGHGEGCTRIVGRRVYQRCKDLGVQEASIAYTYNRATHRLEVAFFGQAKQGGWVGWGINPTAWGMVGSSVLVAFQGHNGTNVLPFKLSPAAQAGQRLVSGTVDMSIISRQAIIRGGSFIIMASLQLRPSQPTVLNMIWNRGTAVAGFSPLPHSLLPQDLRGFTSINVAD
ncbi:hypothetical protein L7F22_016029 [Adiantum nelumboides]|nr:hypothetical protein [Adiantum nelumboides]